MLAFLSKYVFVFVNWHLLPAYDRATILRCVVCASSFMWFRTSVSLLRGDGEIRTLDPLLARQVLSQLSYTPVVWLLFFVPFCFFMGLSGLEPPTSRLSGVRSNRLSYKPFLIESGSHLLSHIVSNAVPSAV
jgi:hypothetical protein